MLTAIVFGLMLGAAPARTGSADSLRDSADNLGSRDAHRLGVRSSSARSLSLILVGQAGWLLRSFIRMSNAEPGSGRRRREIPLSIPTSRH
jgi:HEAT repeat protein